MLGPKKLLMAGVPLDIDARAYIARMSTRPDRARQKLISDTIKALKADGIWQTLDALYLFAAHSAQAALLNVVQDRFNATATASVTFTANDRLTVPGGNNNAQLINSNLAMNAGSLRIAQTSGSAAVYWSIDRSSVSGADDEAAFIGPNSRIDYDDGNTRYRLFSGTFISAANARTGFSLDQVTRSGTSVVGITNGQQAVTGTIASAAPGTDTFMFRGNFSADRRFYRAAAIGAHMTVAQAASLNTILRNYLSSIGAPA